MSDNGDFWPSRAWTMTHTIMWQTAAQYLGTSTLRWLQLKKFGVCGRAASLAALFWSALHAIASCAPRRGAVLDISEKLLETIRTDLCVCALCAAETQLHPFERVSQ